MTSRSTSSTVPLAVLARKQARRGRLVRHHRAMPALAIDFVSDVICPWCFIGFTRLEQALAQAGEEGAAVTLRPFQLDPSTPPEGADLREA